MSDMSDTKQESKKVEYTTLSIPFVDSYTYSNCSAFIMSALDMRISFGEALDNTQVVARVGIVMPPEHAAHLVLNLLRQLQAFEKAFGPVRNPEWQNFKNMAATRALGLTSIEPDQEEPSTDT